MSHSRCCVVDARRESRASGLQIALRAARFWHCACNALLDAPCSREYVRILGHRGKVDHDHRLLRPETMRSSRAGFATVTHAPIDLPEQVLVMIVSRVRDVRPATAEADARSLCADVMHGIGSVSRLWRKLAKGVLMGDELAWLRVRGAAAAAECLSCFPRALSVRIVGDARAGDIGAVLGSRSVMRLALAAGSVMHGCEGLGGQLVGPRALYIEA